MYNSVQVIQVKPGCVTLKWGGSVKIGKMGPSPSGSSLCCVRIQRANDWRIQWLTMHLFEKKGIYQLTCSSFGCYVIAMRKGNKCRVWKEMVWFEWWSVYQTDQVFDAIQVKTKTVLCVPENHAKLRHQFILFCILNLMRYQNGFSKSDYVRFFKSHVCLVFVFWTWSG